MASDETTRTKLVIFLTKGESIFIATGGQEVEIKVADSNRQSGARLCFEAPKSVEIMRLKKDGTMQGGSRG